MSLHERLMAARWARPREQVLKHARVINVFSGSIEGPTDLAISAGVIVGVGSGYEGTHEIDLAGAYVAPGLIDAHVHIESSLCTPPQFAAAVVGRGVTTVVADPHEIANVCGVDGVRFMRESAVGIPLTVLQMAPSCVPATHLATAGAELDAQDLARLLRDGLVHGLAEVMNFPGVINADASVLQKLAEFERVMIDGHAPGVVGRALNAYVASGVGSDHECVSVTEAFEKLSRGLYVLIREASNARNLDTLLPLITPATSRRICFCTDDRTPGDLVEQGSIDHMLRTAISAGVEPVEAFRLCTLNPAEWFRLYDRGAIAPGRVADLFVFDDLRKPVARRVFRAGEEVTASSFNNDTGPVRLRDTFRATLTDLNFDIVARSSRVRVIGSRPDQLITDARITDARVVNGMAEADVSRDLLKMAVIERHGRSGTRGLGFIQGIGLRRGAIAGTVAHDHHNLVVIGADDASMLTAARVVKEMGGGLVACDGQQVLASLPLPVAGLMSDRPLGEVCAAHAKLVKASRELGSTLHDPFMAMSFMALEVIPSLKLTDRGLVDVEQFAIVDLFV